MLPAPNTTGAVSDLRSIAVEPYRTPLCIWFVVERVAASCRPSLRQRRTFVWDGRDLSDVGPFNPKPSVGSSAMSAAAIFLPKIA
ncbi:hypothetical protein ACQGFJ_01365 [Rhodococcus sp. 3.70]